MWNPSGCDREGSIVVSFIGRSSGDGVEFQKMPIYRVKSALIVVLWKWFGSAAMDHAF